MADHTSSSYDWKKSNIFLLLFALLFSVLLTECALRWIGKYATYTERYGGDYQSLYQSGERNWHHVYEPFSMRRDYSTEFDFSFRANNEGLLDTIFSAEKPTNTKRILFIGDSFVQGIGASQAQSCPKELERLLNETSVDSIGYEVWNCGVGGADPVFAYRLLQDKLMRYKPDVVLLGINGTDWNDIILRGGHERFLADSSVSYTEAPWFEPMYERSYLFRLLLHDLLGYNWLLLTKAAYAQRQKISTDVVLQTISRFQTLCAKNGVSFSVLLQPLDYEFEKRSAEWLAEIEAYSKNQQINNLVVLPCLLKSGKSKADIYWPIDGHFNQAGYALYARCIADYLLSDTTLAK